MCGKDDTATHSAGCETRSVTDTKCLKEYNKIVEDENRVLRDKASVEELCLFMEFYVVSEWNHRSVLMSKQFLSPFCKHALASLYSG